MKNIADMERSTKIVLQDLAGPKVRIGMLTHGSFELEPGRGFTLTTRPVEGSRDGVSVSYAGLPAVVGVGDTLLLADGVILLRVERVTDEEIHCQVIVGGRLGSRKGVNVPSGLPGLPILGDKDLRDLRVGLEQGIDYLGLSFVRSAEDVRAARAHIERLGGHVPVIAKIETQAALDHFDEILDAADGIMIARGDLSIETPFARVPIVQKNLIAEANRRAKPVITATQMLFSMVSSPQPTRAEVADVANAVLDGSDAVMLSEETAVGRHPVRAVEVMAAIALETERGVLQGPRPSGAWAGPVADEGRRHAERGAHEAGRHAQQPLPPRAPGQLVTLPDPRWQQADGLQAHQREGRGGQARRRRMDHVAGHLARGVRDGDRAAREHGVHVPAELPEGARQASGRDAERRLDRRRFRAVAVLVLHGERPHVPLVHAQVHVEQRRVDPGEQRRVVGRVRRAGGKRPGGPGQVAVHAVVNAVDACQHRSRLRLGAEGDLQHRVDRAVEAPHPAVPLRAERAVVRDALGHQRVRQLHQDGRPPGEEEDDLALQSPAHGRSGFKRTTHRVE